VALSIVKEGTDYINQLAHKILEENPGRLCILGGLRLKVTPWLDDTIQSKLSDPMHSPEDGAIYYAKAELARARANTA
jgi:glucosamine kinase